MHLKDVRRPFETKVLPFILRSNSTSRKKRASSRWRCTQPHGGTPQKMALSTSQHCGPALRMEAIRRSYYTPAAFFVVLCFMSFSALLSSMTRNKIVHLSYEAIRWVKSAPTGVRLMFLLTVSWSLAWLVLRPWRWSMHFCPKRRWNHALLSKCWAKSLRPKVCGVLVTLSYSYNEYFTAVTMKNAVF
jgi:hypothetical protein